MSGLALFGAAAGGAAVGIQQQQKIALEREASKRADEEHQLRMEEGADVRLKRERRETALKEVNDFTASYMRGGAPAPETPAGPAPLGTQPAKPGTMAAYQQPQAPTQTPAQAAGLSTVVPDATGAGAPITGVSPAVQQPKVTAGPVDTSAGASIDGLAKVDRSAATGKTPDDAVTRALWSNPNMARDPDWLNGMAKIFMKHDVNEGVKWLERVYGAQKENAISAAQLLIAGKPDEAIQHFNSSGAARVTDIQPADPKLAADDPKQRWTITHEGGKSETLDARALMRSTLDPKEFFKSLQEQGAADYYGAHSDQVRADTRVKNAEAANLEAGRPKNGAAGKVPKNATLTDLPVYKELNDLAEKQYGQMDPASGKIKNTTEVTQAAANSARVWKGNQHLDPSTAFQVGTQGKPDERIQIDTDTGKIYAVPYMVFGGRAYPMDSNDPEETRRDVTNDPAYKKYLPADKRTYDQHNASQRPVKKRPAPAAQPAATQAADQTDMALKNRPGSVSGKIRRPTPAAEPGLERLASQ